MTRLAAQSVLVTGANRGLGRELVAQLLQRDVATVYAGARDPESIDDRDPRVVPMRLDVTDTASIAAAAASAGDVGIVINNAGISLASPVLADGSDDLRRELEVNLFGPLAVTSAFGAGVIDQSGAVVNIASVLSWIALGGTYSVTKAALWSATDAMRLELGPHGVQVVGVHMGYVDTDMTAGVDAPKAAAADVARQILDGVESGVNEILADETARQVRQTMNLSIDERYAPFLAAGRG